VPSRTVPSTLRKSSVASGERGSAGPPATIGEAQELLGTDEALTPCQDERYAFFEIHSSYGNIPQRWILFQSRDMAEKEERTLEKRIDHLLADARKDFAKRDCGQNLGLLTRQEAVHVLQRRTNESSRALHEIRQKRGGGPSGSAALQIQKRAGHGTGFFLKKKNLGSPITDLRELPNARTSRNTRRYVTPLIMDGPPLEQPEPWVTLLRETLRQWCRELIPRRMQKRQRVAPLFGGAEKSIGGTPSHREVRRKQDGRRTGGKVFQTGRFPPEPFAARQGGHAIMTPHSAVGF